MNDHFGSTTGCLYETANYIEQIKKTIKFAGKYWALMFRGCEGGFRY
jgi:hypothetical protein